jgi:glutaredoxin-like YruB-family protein
MKKVAIYTTPVCVYCKKAKDFFKKNNVQYEEYNVMSDIARREEMITRSGQMGVPVIDIGGALIVGYDERRLKELLDIK